MFFSVSPAPQLSALVQAYWFIEDLLGEHEGSHIRTSPIPLAVLSVNMGRPNAQENGGLVPNASLLGLQSRARAWQSWSETYFVMAMLTIPGFIRLFPNVGADSADMLLDLGAIAGDAQARSLIDDIGADQGPRRVAAMLDKWLIARSISTSPTTELRQITVAHDILRRGGTVERSARTAQVNRRQLHRLFHRHLGVGPQELVVLERLQSSLSGVETGLGDPCMASAIRRIRSAVGGGVSALRLEPFRARPGRRWRTGSSWGTAMLGSGMLATHLRADIGHSTAWATSGLGKTKNKWTDQRSYDRRSR